MNNVLKRLLTIMAALVLLVYVGYQGYQTLFSSTQTMTMQHYYPLFMTHQTPT